MDREQAIEKMAQEIANYLTNRFIGQPEDYPDNECLKEAKVILAKVGYCLPPELKVLSDEEIKAKLKEIEPEGFNWTDMTNQEIIKFRLFGKQ